VSNKNLSQLITELKKLPKAELEKARKFIPLMILQMQDEDLKQLGKDFKKEEWMHILMAMLLFPKEKWKELGIPDYLMKYEIEDEEEE